MDLSRFRYYFFYLLVFILPWQTRWIIRDPSWGGDVWEYSRISLYSWDIVLALLVLISLPLVWQEIKKFKFQNPNAKSNPNAQNSNSKAFFVYLLLLLYAFVSTLWSPDRLLALLWSLRLFEGGILWFLAKALKPKLELVLLSLAAAGTLQALWSIWQFVTQTTFANKWLGVAIHPISQGGTSVVLTQAGIWLRAYAGQVHPNVLGGLLVVSCLATVYLIIKNYKFKIINFYWLLVLYVVQLTGLFFSFSRGAWLALAASLCLWWWHSRPNRRELWSAFGWAAVVFVVLTMILWQPTAGRFFGHSRLEQQSVEERVGSVGESRSLLSGSWWHGVGYGNYTVALEQFQPGLRSWRYQPVHNIFLLVLTELGVVGLGLFLWLLWIILSPLTTRSSPLVLVAGGWWLVAIIFTALFDHYWWTAPSMVLLFWLVIASASAGEQPPGQGS